VCGIAWDFCVGETALDAKKLGYNVFFIEDATAAVFPPNSKSNDQGTVGVMNAKLREANVDFTNSRLIRKRSNENDTDGFSNSKKPKTTAKSKKNKKKKKNKKRKLKMKNL